MRPAPIHLLTAAGLACLVLVLAGCKGIATEDVQADLKAEAITTDPAVVTQLSLASIRVRFSNQGATSNDLGFNVKIEIRNSLGDLLAQDEKHFSGTLDEDELAFIDFTGLVDSGSGVGDYDITAFIDSDDDVDELNEDNNTGFGDVTVTPKTSN